jgi:hypothetical protein
MIPAGLVALAACLAPAQAEARPGEKWKFDFKLSVVEKEGEYVFVLEGTSNVPKEVILRARVYTVTLVDDFNRGKREDDTEPLVWEGDGDQPGSQNFQVEDGRFRVEVYRFARRPWALHYRAKIHYLPRLQSDEALKVMGEEDFERPADLKYGDAKLYREQMQERIKEVYADIAEIEALFKEFKAKFLEQLAKNDPDGWRAWKDTWFAKVEKIVERNKLRFGMWAVWMERQAKLRVGGICDMLRRKLIECTEHLEGKQKELPQFADLQVMLEEIVEVLGLEVPLDIEKVSPPMTAYERGLEPVRAWIARGQGDRMAVRAAARRTCTEALLEIGPMVETRRRAYKYLNDLSGAFRRLLDLVGREDAEALRAALIEHDDALRAFRKFAGLK